MKKRGFSLLCAVAMTLGLLVVSAAQVETGLSAKGWFETICAQLIGASDSDVTAVRYTGEDGQSVALTGEDFDFLVRDMEGGVRIDIPGVRAGTYRLEVETADKTYTAHGIQVTAYDRSGYAHWNYTDQGQLALTDPPGQGERVVVGCYDGRGQLLEAKALTAARRETPLEADIAVVKLFWLDDKARPLSQAVTVWGNE